MPLVIPHKGHRPRISEGAFIAPGAVVIGDVEIGARSGVWFNCTLRGDVHEIRVGERTNIQDGSVVHVAANKFGCYIGSDITIGHNAVIHACTLEDGCFIGMSATVMDGAVVESQAMVAAGALVTPGKRVRRGELWGGSPAKFLRELTPEELASFPQTAEHYAKLAESYMAE